MVEDFLDLSKDDQDIIVSLMIFDTEFLERCVRKGVSKELFSSDVRQKTVSIIYDFFMKYSKSPRETIAELIQESMKTGRINDNDEDLFYSYLEKLSNIDLSNVRTEYVLDKIDDFIKKRILLTTTNQLQKMKERIVVGTDKPIKVLRKAIEDIDRLVDRKTIESLLDENTYDFSEDMLTRFNIPEIDKAIGGGLKRGNFAVIQAYTNRGKTWSCAHLAKIAARFGNPSLLIGVEVANKTLKLRLKMSMTGLTMDEIAKQPGAVKNLIKTSMVKKSDIILLSDEEKGMHVDNLSVILKEIEDVKGYKPELILLDSADDMLPPRSSSRYRDKLDESTAIYTWLKNFAKDNDVCIVTTSQTKRIGETKFWITTSDIGDNINKMRKCTIGVSLNASEAEMNLGFLRFYLNKNTDGPVGAKAWAKQNLNIGQFIIDSGRYDWAEYKEMLKRVGGEEFWKKNKK